MLADATRFLARQGRIVTVIARHARSLARLMDGCTDAAHAIRPLPLDYCHHEALHRALIERQEVDGPFDLVVCWMHDTAADGPTVVAQAIEGHAGATTPCQFVHVIASATRSPMDAARRWQARLHHRPGISYHQVILGYHREGGRTRWLHDDEISAGVIEAVERAEPRRIIGAVSPWEGRP